LTRLAERLCSFELWCALVEPVRSGVPLDSGQFRALWDKARTNRWVTTAINPNIIPTRVGVANQPAIIFCVVPLRPDKSEWLEYLCYS